MLRGALDPEPARRPPDAASLGNSLAALGDGSISPQRERNWPAGVVTGVAVMVFVLAAVVVWALR